MQHRHAILRRTISIHAPHEGERRHGYLVYRAALLKFQSTLPTRGSDPVLSEVSAYFSDFNPRSPRGGATMSARQDAGLFIPFQSTLPTRGSDRYRSWTRWRTMTFQSTLPTRGSDLVPTRISPTCRPFQSTLPTRGSDAIRSAFSQSYTGFQSTLPTRGSDELAARLLPVSHEFQSTLPTRGSDYVAAVGFLHVRHFNPRSPRGGATISRRQC